MNIYMLIVSATLLVSGTSAATLYEELTLLNATTVLNLVNQAGLASLLQNSTSGFTLLVPTDHAFAKLPQADLQAVSSNPQRLVDVIKYHMITGIHLKQEFLFQRHYFLNSTNGHVIRVLRSTTGLHFNQATATKTDVHAANGVIHVIDTVLDVPEGTVMDILANKDYNLTKFLNLVKTARLDHNYAMPSINFSI